MCYSQYGWYRFLWWRGPLHGTRRDGHEILISTGGLGFFAKISVAREYLLEFDTLLAIATSGWKTTTTIVRAPPSEQPAIRFSRETVHPPPPPPNVTTIICLEYCYAILGELTEKFRDHQDMNSSGIVLRNWWLQRPQTLLC